MRVSNKIRWLGAVLGLTVAPAAWGQGVWAVRATDADSVALWADGISSPEAALEAFHRRGHFRARVDSASVDTLYVTAGPRAVVGIVDVVGASALDAAGVREGWATEPGASYDADRLARDLAGSAERYAAFGYSEAALSPSLRIQQDGAAVDIEVRVAEGPAGRVVGVEVVGARRAARAFVSRVAGVEVGTPVGRVDRSAVRRALEATGLYAEVGEPLVARTPSGDLVVQVPVREAPPGTFDAVIGYLPPAGGTGGGFVGNGRVALRNLFGGGRTADVEVVRNPGLAASLDLALADPFAFGTPFGLGLRFAGESRDSTYSRQRYALDLSYPIAEGLSLVGSASREVVRPGTFGADTLDGRPRIRRSDTFFLALGVGYRRLDAPRNPRRGATLAVRVEQGRPRGQAAPGALSEEGGAALRRLWAEARGYLPALPRQTLVLGLDAALVQRGGAGAAFDEADLFRLGGARSLRGYDEEAFLGRAVGRALVEYRHLLDAESFAFAFGDLGVVDRPPLPGLDDETRWLPGYGAGLRVRTGVGLASVSYALSPDLALTQGKVHLGLALGL